MTATRTIDGKKYLMRDRRPTTELRKLYREFCEKFSSGMTFHHWMIERGKVYFVVKSR